MISKKEWLESDSGRRARYERRRSRRLSLGTSAVEPQSKNMPPAERDRFQNIVIAQMAAAKRYAYAGKLALQIQLATTSKNAPQAHTIAKNLLDLLGPRRPTVAGQRAHLLYRDDSHIEALSVSCRHGEDQPFIHMTSRRFADMLDDVELAMEALRKEEDSPSRWMREQHDEDAVDNLREALRDEQLMRERLGDKTYEAYFKMVRWSAQRAILKRSALEPRTLGWLYRLPRNPLFGFAGLDWSEIIKSSRLRLQVGDLPIAPGSSSLFKAGVAAKVQRFKSEWGWLIDPLLLPVAVEVVVRPNPATPKGVLHDLDNVVRDYLLPGIIPAFGTVTDHRWTLNLPELERTDPDLAKRWLPMPPKGTRTGVTRYEAWRLPPEAGKDGFVSVALVADIDANGGLIEQVDRVNSRWASSLVRNRY